MLGVTAFREAFLNADSQGNDSFESFTARQLRYEIFWSAFQNTLYRDVNRWSPKLRADYGLYKYTRPIYNPAYRLAKFWQSHLQGGQLDLQAGDGKAISSALPIVTENDAMRIALAQLWRDSNWQIRKDIFTLYGTVFGDVALKVIDDTARQKVYLHVVHPATLKEVLLDPFGNVKGYVIQELRQDPRTTSEKQVVYSEIVTREQDGDGNNTENVKFKTLLDNQPYAWNGIAAEWAEPYGFVPLVVVQHHNVGLEWGWSEFQAGQAKFRELDDLASLVHDQIRKMVNSGWLFTGVSAPKDGATPTANKKDASTSNPSNEREQTPIFYAPAGADAKPLVASLDLAAAGQRLDALVSELERDYPELKVDELRLSGELTGRALMLAQQPAEDKCYQLRAGYDDGLVRAQSMAIAVGGMREYDGYKGFDLGSYAKGNLNHSIGHRRVFAQTPLDELEEKKLFWEVKQSARDAGAPIPRQIAWREAGYQGIEDMEKQLQAEMETNVNAALSEAVTGLTQ